MKRVTPQKCIFWDYFTRPCELWLKLRRLVEKIFLKTSVLCFYILSLALFLYVKFQTKRWTFLPKSCCFQRELHWHWYKRVHVTCWTRVNFQDSYLEHSNISQRLYLTSAFIMLPSTVWILSNQAGNNFLARCEVCGGGGGRRRRRGFIHNCCKGNPPPSTP